MPRAILCILDSFGIGGAPDAADYGDGHGQPIPAPTRLGPHRRRKLRSARRLPNLDASGSAPPRKLSTGTIPPGLTDQPKGGRWGVGREVSQGQGHALRPLGNRRRAGAVRLGLFPPDRADLSARSDRRVRRARQAARHSRRQARLGHRRSSPNWARSTSAPASRSATPRSTRVFQIAAHETHFGLERLYEICQIAFELTAPLMIGRVIARPFVGETPGDLQAHRQPPRLRHRAARADPARSRQGRRPAGLSPSARFPTSMPATASPTRSRRRATWCCSTAPSKPWKWPPTAPSS